MDRARRPGIDADFRGSVEPHRRELLAHCYRMLGSLADAEDALQETLVRAWRGAPRFEGRSSLRAWLHAIATRACLDALAGRRRRVLPPGYGPAAASPEAPPEPVDEPVWLEPFPDALLPPAEARPDARYSQRESVALAFLAAIQRIPPRPRAALLLRDVLGFTAADAAEILGTTVAAANSALQRARETLDGASPAGAPEVEPPDDAQAALVGRYVRAFESGDVAALAALLREAAVLSMPPDALWFRGRDAIAAFLARGPLAGDARGRWRLVPAGRANGLPALALYERDEAAGAYRAFAVKVLAVRRGGIAEVTGFLDARLFPRFGVPAWVSIGPAAHEGLERRS